MIRWWLRRLERHEGLALEVVDKHGGEARGLDIKHETGLGWRIYSVLARLVEKGTLIREARIEADTAAARYGYEIPTYFYRRPEVV